MAGMRISQLNASKRWMRQISGNRKQWRRHGVPGSTCFRGAWRAFLRGRQRQKNGARSKQAKELEKFVRDLWRDHCWSILCMQEFTSSNGDLVTETTEGQRLHVRQRRLAMVVAAAFTKCIVNSSFRVRGRNCSIDVCWERKKFRVICSLLTPGSVTHMYARDLLLTVVTVVTSRAKDAHVHICVDARTGLGTGVLRSVSSNIGSATTSCRKTETSRVFRHGTSADSHEHFQQ